MRWLSFKLEWKLTGLRKRVAPKQTLAKHPTPDIYMTIVMKKSTSRNWSLQLLQNRASIHLPLSNPTLIMTIFTLRVFDFPFFKCVFLLLILSSEVQTNFTISRTRYIYTVLWLRCLPLRLSKRQYQPERQQSFYNNFYYTHQDDHIFPTITISDHSSSVFFFKSLAVLFNIGCFPTLF